MSDRGVAPVATSIDQVQLKRRLRKTERERKVVAIVLLAPLLLFLTVNFVAPVASMLIRSVDDREVGRVLARTHQALSDWDGSEMPGEPAFRALVEDLRRSEETNTTHIASKRLNAAKSGFRPLLKKTARRLPDPQAPSAKAALLDLDRRWADTSYWAVIKRTSSPITPAYLLAAFDLRLDEAGTIARAPEYLRAFNVVWLRTFWMALVITGICVALGYPLAYGLAHMPAKVSNILLIFVLLPFWTAALVRTTAWIIILQNEGLVNDLGLYFGFWSDRIQMIRNRFGVYVAMAHVLLPYMVLPLYAIMKRIPPDYGRAAQSLGASPLVAFVRVYFPLTIHGLGAGSMFVFILAIGFYITPALVGGRDDQMITWYIAWYTSLTLNWGAAAALSAMLLVFTVILYALMDKGFGISRLRMQRE